jgi:hypothetical protein
MVVPGFPKPPGLRLGDGVFGGSSFGSSILWGSSLRFSFRRHSPLRSTPWGVVAAGFSEAQLVSNAATQAVAAVTRNK